MGEACQSVFQRYEKKYMLDRQQYDRLGRMLADRMEADAYGRYTICNLYYDTSDYRMIRTSLEKPVYKEKLRVRSYGVPGEEDSVFVELKKKYEGIVYKRRIALPKAQASACLKAGSFREAVAPDSPDGQIAGELNWVLRYYRPLPVLYLAYDRTAWRGKDNPDLRITFDTEIRFRQDRLDLSAGDEGERLLVEDSILMEVKFPHSMPLWLARELSCLSVFPVSFSKYGSCYQKRLLGQKQKSAGAAERVLTAGEQRQRKEPHRQRQGGKRYA